MAKSRADDTRYGLPPQRDPFEPFPTEIPWDTPISELGWWLKITAEGVTTVYPLRLMAARHGWKLTLRQAVAKLKSKTGADPESVILMKDGGMEFRKSRRLAGQYHVLVGPEPELRD